MILHNYDFHVHTSFSGDCEVPVRAMIEQGISLELSGMCITDHLDYDYPGESEGYFDLPEQEYYHQIHALSTEYQDRISIMAGVEIGLVPIQKQRIDAFLDKNPYDFIIGSSHLVHGADPYYPSYFENRSEHAAFTEYFESILENIHTFDNFDVYGHLDYVVRYAPHKTEHYQIQTFRPILEEILRELIIHNHGIEVNTGGYRSGLSFPNPHPDVLRLYRELGGEVITIGSDAHRREHLGNNIEKAKELLRSLGYRYYTIFQNRKPQFIPL